MGSQSYQYFYKITIIFSNNEKLDNLGENNDNDKKNNDVVKQKSETKINNEEEAEVVEELEDEIDDEQDNSSMSLAVLENLIRDQVMEELNIFSRLPRDM